MNYLINNNLIKNRIFRHVLYWISFILFFGFIWGSYDNNYSRSIIVQFSFLPSRILLVYTTLYYLIPKFLLKKRTILFILLYITLLVIITIYIQKPIMWYFLRPNYLTDWKEEDYLSFISVMNTLFELNRAAIIPLIITFYKLYYTEQKKILILEKEQLKSELAQLKNQIHPHFLFNTLNNLYSLILNKSNKAEDAILKLSKLMRYMLYETSPNKVSLLNEIEYLKNYINLEKLRLDENNSVNFNVKVDKDYKIAPFILIPFIENVFKHGIVNNEISTAFINITVKNGNLILHTLNDKKSENNEEKGVGFKNVQKRLELLYNKRYVIEKKETDSLFEFNLKLKLT